MNGGAHATFHSSFGRYLWNDKAAERMQASNPVVQRAAAEMKHNFAHAKRAFEAGEDWGGLWFVDLFCTRLVFWGMVGVDMGDDPSSEVYRTAMWAQNNNPATSRHMVVPPGEVIGKVYAAQIEEKVASLRKIFAASPALADYEPLEAIPEDASELRRADYHGHPPRRVSKAEFIDQLVPATIIAGLLGPKTLANALMMSFFGGLDIGPLSTAEERATPQCPPPGFDFPFGDDDKLRLVILESLRLAPAVYETVFLLPEESSVADYAGLGPKRFPAGCPVMLSYVNTAFDPAIWGNTARDFDPYGHAAELDGPQARFNGFNGVGPRGQRACPGRGLAMAIMLHMLNAIDPHERVFAS